MNARTREAIAACTRTLAATHDADGAVAASTATTVGALRAVADRAALRRRFLSDAEASSFRPAHPQTATLYEALLQARLDAIGVAWLVGVKNNLLEFPGLDDDGARWLAFEHLSGMPAPKEKSGHVTRARNATGAGLADQLTDLRTLISDEQRFCKAAAEWSQRAAGHAPLPVRHEASHRFRIPTGSAGVDIRQGRYALPAGDRNPNRRDAADEAEGHGSSSPPRDAVEAMTGYRAFTTACDRVINAAALASRDDLARLRTELDADFRPMRSMVARLSKRLMRELMARQAREWRFDLDEGLLDQSRLPVFVASGGSVRPFKWEFDSPFPSTVVTLLIDHSGSMKGRPMKIAALTVEIFVRVLERCGVACEVLGFTTRDWDGGEPARKWADAGYPEHPGRLNALEHIVIKPASVPWRRARLALGLFLHNEMLKENIDGEALAWAHGRLMARSEKRRIMVVVSDGAPMDEATAAANGFDYLDGHLAAVVQHIETRSSIRLAAIGIGHNVSQFYSNATRIAKVDDLGPALAAKLSGLLTE